MPHQTSDRWFKKSMCMYNKVGNDSRYQKANTDLRSYLVFLAREKIFVHHGEVRGTVFWKRACQARWCGLCYAVYFLRADLEKASRCEQVGRTSWSIGTLNFIRMRRIWLNQYFPHWPNKGTSTYLREVRPVQILAFFRCLSRNHPPDKNISPRRIHLCCGISPEC